MDELQKYSGLIIDYARSNYKKMFREPDGILKHKFIVPGSCYSNSLWDWDSWLTNIALRRINGADDISEYYDPETGIGINNKGFQNWNLLSVDMIEWLGLE